MTLLLLHPIGLDALTWRSLPVEHAIAVDLPGHGEVSWRAMSSLGEVADAVVADHGFSGDPLDVVGVSLGGMVALHIALKHPLLVRSIVVACAPAATPSELLIERADTTEALGMGGTLDATIQRWFTSQQISRRDAVVIDTERRLMADDPAVVACYWRLMAEHDVRDRLGQNRVPTTALAARDDRSTPSSELRRLARDVTQGRYVELDGPHMVHLSDPVGFANALASHPRWVDNIASG